jgi:hypothetical protein
MAKRQGDVDLRFTQVEASIPVDVVGMHLNLNGFSDEAIHVAGFCNEDFRVFQSDCVVLIKTVFSYC